jgi:hypothetical protein
VGNSVKTREEGSWAIVQRGAIVVPILDGSSFAA